MVTKTPGKLFLTTLRGQERLVFLPLVYPSSQIQNLGFTSTDLQDHVVWQRRADVKIIPSLLSMFPGVELSDAVWAWLKAEKERLDQQQQAERQAATTLDSDKDLFDYQKEAVAFLMSRPRALLALAPGLGKTACSLKAAAYGGYQRVLVAAPLSLLRNWQAEVRKWVPGANVEIWHREAAAQDRHWKSDKPLFVITNYETIVRRLDHIASYEFDLVICDETVLLKNRRARRTLAVSELVRKLGPACWHLSGAPAAKFFDDLWAQLHILDQQQFSSYWRFAHTYCQVVQNQWGTQIVANKPDAATRIQQDLHHIYFARSQDEVLDLPDWIFSNVEIDMAPGQERMYRQMETEFIASLPDGDEVLAPNVLTQLLRLVQIASNPMLIGGNDLSEKWAALNEILEYEQLPAIIWTSFIRTAEEVSQRLSRKYKVAVITGNTPADERQSIVNRFQDGYLDIIVAHPAVGKFGLTLTRGRTAIYLERGYNGDDYYQSLHRIRRIGTQHSPHIIHLMSTKRGGRTVDHVIDDVLRYRKENNLAITSGMLRKAFTGEL